MRRLLFAGLLAVSAAVPTTPAVAGPAYCVVTAGFPVCAGTCRPGEPVSVQATGSGGTYGTASCGGASAHCTVFRVTCSDSATATGSGSLSCSGTAQVVVCSVGLSPR